MMLDVLVETLECTPSFDMGRFNFGLVELAPVHLWSDDHLERMRVAAKENGQLRECGIEDQGRLPDALEALIVRARGARNRAGAAISSGRQQSATASTTLAGGGSPDDFRDAPLLNWQSPVVKVDAEGRF